MSKLEYGNIVFEVDTENTKEYYKHSTLCDCEYCSLYSTKISGQFPKLEAFLQGFGIDIKKPDETAPIETDGGILYTMVGYTACGKIKQGENEEIILDGLKISLCNGFDFPNEQSADYFSITIYDITIS